MRISRRFLLAATAGASLPGRAEERPDRWRETLAFLQAERAAGTLPGAALVVRQDGRPALERYEGTYCGLRRRDEPLDGKVRHPLYSYSKLISATVVMLAVQDGLVALDTPVSAYLPQFTGGGKERITLRHLLTHAAGIPNVTIGSVSTEAGWEAAVAALCAAKTEWEPGSRTAYHGLTGLLVAAEAVRRRTGGKRWEALCRERLFRPLGANSLTFEIPENEPVALTPQPAELPKTPAEAFPHAGQPAGGCFGTAADALKVLQLHLDAGRWHGTRLLSEPLAREMRRVQYAREIAAAREAGKAPDHEPWGLGLLLRGTGPAAGGHGWFGLRDQGSPSVFGHAGIDTVIGVADPDRRSALLFISTASPPSAEKTVALRNGVVNRVFSAVDQRR
ncbi:MAG: serine hydrolase domain-containing protein [Armatimonadota bacterium]